MNKLDQIIEKIALDFPFNLDEAPRTFAEKVALEFGKHLLEEAAENAETKDTGFIGEDGWESYQEVDKKSIKDTINKYL